MGIHPEATLVIVWLSTGSPAVSSLYANVECCPQPSRWAQTESAGPKSPPAPARPASAPQEEGPRLSSESATPVRPGGAPIDPSNVGGPREPRPNRSPK
jgi:hypothetical protein